MAATVCAQTVTTINKMANHRFTGGELHRLADCASRILAGAGYFLALSSAGFSSFLRYLAGSFLKSFKQPLQQSLISWPSWTKE